MVGSISFPLVVSPVRAQRDVHDFGASALANEADAVQAITEDAITPASQAESRGDANEGKQSSSPGQPADLSTEEELELRELQERDREVRAHEQAHIGAGGQYVNGGATYSFKRGPDGQQYAIGGEVSISVSRERSPEATLQKARIIRRAALAPADPSGKDRQVASRATSLERQAQAEIAEKREAAASSSTEEHSPAEPTSAGARETSSAPAIVPVRQRLDMHA